MHSTSLRVGVSACLLGQLVRYDGQHKRDDFIADRLARFVDYVPVCPEVEVGMGVPRETIGLRRVGEQTLLLGTRSGVDWTRSMQQFAADRVAQLKQQQLSGFILKARSPSCGMQRVKVEHESQPTSRDGVGLFAAALMRHWPLLPMEEEGRLNDASLRENFCVRLFAFHRLQNLFASDYEAAEVIAFHTREKFLLLAHNETLYRQLGRLTADIANLDQESFRQQYQSEFMQALRPQDVSDQASRNRHTNVMQHLLGFFKTTLNTAARAEILDRIAEYHAGLTPLIAPLTLIRHYAKVHDVGYLNRQTYLAPYPQGLIPSPP